MPGNGTVSDPNQNDPWREGNTRPGGAQLLMVLATSMGSAGISSLALGSFMCSLVVVCRWFDVDPGELGVALTKMMFEVTRPLAHLHRKEE